MGGRGWRILAGGRAWLRLHLIPLVRGHRGGMEQIGKQRLGLLSVLQTRGVCRRGELGSTESLLGGNRRGGGRERNRGRRRRLLNPLLNPCRLGWLTLGRLRRTCIRDRGNRGLLRGAIAERVVSFKVGNWCRLLSLTYD